MSFLAERLFQVLEKHKLYEHLNTQQALRFFMERHFICAWGYHAILRSIDRELSSTPLVLFSHDVKEALRLVSEIILDEEVADLGDGRLASHFELYLEAMQDLGCDLTNILDFLDGLDAGLSVVEAARNAGLEDEVVNYAAYIEQTILLPIHVRAVSLFYEGEPYLPDSLLIKLSTHGPKIKAERLLDYLERHIEGIKHPGFSPAARLVELFCGVDSERNDAAEKMAERVLRLRIELWNDILKKLLMQTLIPEFPVTRQSVCHLRLVQ